MKMYRIEMENPIFYHSLYRFVSLYNGVRGPWHGVESKAIADGQTHQKIIEDLKSHGIELND